MIVRILHNTVCYPFWLKKTIWVVTFNVQTTIDVQLLTPCI